MRKLLASWVFLVLLFGASAAHAHANLDHSSPAAGATLSQAPAEIRLEFSEELWPHQSGLTLSKEGGITVPVTIADSQTPSVLIAKPKTPLGPGIYKVAWHATCIYSHETQGSFNFTVNP